MSVGHQDTRRLHVANRVFVVVVVVLSEHLRSRSRLILIDDVTVNVFLFTGSYSLILRL